ncbi:hypothetical protein EDD85DRAFT_922454 [Armillaria nabsnona]|nr:hypothetical protein EDD85DRAFT_922454 [Armillaria nabsnona]
MVLMVPPLSALMIDQAIVSGLYWQIIVSPEIAISSSFRKCVLSKPQVTSKLRAVCIDEAHCVSLWGGSFHEDYANIGVLRGFFPSNVPFMVSSATLPDHILDDVHVKLGLANDAKTISLTNARPNIALSCRPMKYSEESKADLQFLIPPDATAPDDIDITLVYCNEQLTMEDQCDVMQRWAKEANIPDSQGCDMHNIKWVILWGLPLSFCALVQRAGRAVRDLNILREAILIVSASLIKKGTTETEVGDCVTLASHSTEADNLPHATGMEPEGDIEPKFVAGNERTNIDEGGVHVETGEDVEIEDEEETVKHRRRKKMKECNSMEAKYLTSACCCDICKPRLFGTEAISVEKKPGLKRSKKKVMPKTFVESVREGLREWREELVETIYPNTITISPATVLGDDIIEQLATCRERIGDANELKQRTHWFLGIEGSTGELTSHGVRLLEKLGEIYQDYDERVEQERKRLEELAKPLWPISPAWFYSNTGNQSQTEQ